MGLGGWDGKGRVGTGWVWVKGTKGTNGVNHSHSCGLRELMVNASMQIQLCRSVAKETRWGTPD